MSRRLRQLIENQAKVKVAQHAQEDVLGLVWFATLVAVSAGVFYFWAYYFLGATGGVLTGH